ADGEVARIVAARFRLPLTLPRADGPAQLHVALGAPGPVSAAFRLGGQRCEALLCGENAIRLDIPTGLTGDAVLEGEIDDPTHRCVLRSLGFFLPRPPQLSAPGPDWATSGEGVGARDIFRL